MTLVPFCSSLASLVFLLAVSLPGQQPQDGPLAPEKYQDIQVLKDVPASQIEATMEYFSAALGFTCANCHVRDRATGEFAFEKDHRTKTDTRDMIRLVQAVNAGDFGARINCGTCHQGHGRPAGLRPAQMMTQAEISAMAARDRFAGSDGERGQRGEAGGQRGEAGGQRRTGDGAGVGRGSSAVGPIFERYLAAIGGQAAVEKLTSKVWKGTVRNRADQSMPFACEAAGDKFHSVVEDARGTQAFGFDGKTGWYRFGTVVHAVEGDPVQMGLRLDDLQPIADFNKRCTKLTGGPGRLPASTPGDPMVAANMVRGESGAGAQERLYFDATSGLLLRRQIVRRTPLNGLLVETIDYSNYKDVSGVMVPHTVRYNSWDRLDVYEVTDVAVGVAVDDAVFAMPKG